MKPIPRLPVVRNYSEFELTRELSRAASIIENAVRRSPSFNTDLRNDCKAALKRLQNACCDLMYEPLAKKEKER